MEWEALWLNPWSLDLDDCTTIYPTPRTHSRDNDKKEDEPSKENTRSDQADDALIPCFESCVELPIEKETEAIYDSALEDYTLIRLNEQDLQVEPPVDIKQEEDAIADDDALMLEAYTLIRLDEQDLRNVCTSIGQQVGILFVQLLLQPLLDAAQQRCHGARLPLPPQRLVRPPRWPAARLPRPEDPHAPARGRQGRRHVMCV